MEIKNNTIPSGSENTNYKFTFKRIRSKLNNFRHKSSNNEIFNRRNLNDPYLYITNFEQATDDECLEADKKNEEIYRQELQTYKEIMSIMEKRKSSFGKPSAPSHPPKPSNIELLHEYRRKYIKTVALEQTEAVIYLYSIGKKYSPYKTNDPNEFEAYDAIPLAKKIKEHFKGDQMFEERSNSKSWTEKSDMMMTELRNNELRSRIHSVYDLEKTPDYHDRVRSASYSTGSNYKEYKNNSINNLYPNLDNVSQEATAPLEIDN